jgi:DNA-binding CsgD family transcriptional regulator
MTARPWGEGATTDTLIEREGEIATLERLLEHAREGAGRVVAIRGEPGIGKTRLLGELRSRGEQALTVLTARGSELERDFPFGCVRQLFDPLLSRGDERARVLLGGDARLAESVFQPPSNLSGPQTDPGYGTLHGLYWLTANLAERGPVLIALDDAHWADPPSLRYVSFLASRLEGVPALVALAMRPAEPGADGGLLRALSDDPALETIDLAPLSEGGVEQLMRAQLDAEPARRVAPLCRRVTGGNPFLLRELLLELRRSGVGPDTALPAAIEGAGPERIAEGVLARLARIGEGAPELARAVAVLGDGAETRIAAMLAELDAGTVARVADDLAVAGILDSGRPLRFVHPIVRSSVYGAMTAGERDRLHRRAAELLADAGEPSDSLAVHLLATEPGGNDRVVESLRAGARAASARGAPEVAVHYLERALAEPPAPGTRAEVLLELGSAAGPLGDPRALEALREAMEAGRGTPVRASAAIGLAVALTFIGRTDDALDVGQRALSEPGVDGEAADGLESLLLSLAQISPAARAPVLELVRGNLDAAVAGEDLSGRRLANAAVECAMTGGDAELTATLAERAASKQLMTGVLSDAADSTFAIGAFVMAERFESAERLLAAVLADARSRGTARGFAAVLCFRCWARLRQGRLADVRADAELYPDLGQVAVTDLVFAGAHLQALVDAGEIEEAARVASPVVASRFDPTLTVYQRFAEGLATLRLAQGDARAALEAAEGVAAWEDGMAQPGGTWVPWRSQAALAHAALGERDVAIRLAEEQVELARRFGAPGMLGSALRALGVVRDADGGVEALRDAASALERSPLRLEHARALIDLGSGLRRASDLEEARDALRDGGELAQRCGATGLADTALDELVAAGGRPRRVAASEADALTPSELRVARMAADGLSNKEIAQALFVTVNTVQTHLQHTYRKLGISSRSQLAPRLPGANADADAGARVSG